ncbi:unnamed protein product [Cuscuta europaea]|uniref:DEUBAD domain-containing protein n=1 Tax=Cuscuta europaea TaxID=41803 RepID=A0A9P1EC56_CUSEU|nr:unnamed protein product [Cuscuta europaea]
MAIEKNCFKSSRLDSELSSHSKEVVMSSDEELLRYNTNSGGVETEDDDDDEEFDDCDSGAGSDDFDLLELGESGEEFCQVGDQTCSIPFELYDLQGLDNILSMDVWNDVLNEEERFTLTQYLPDMDQETFMRTLIELLTGCNLHFGSPLKTLFNMLKGGLCEPRVALYRQGLIFFQKHQHYHTLRKYQNVMVNSFCQIRDGWQNCRGYSIEEKLRVLNIMKTQNSYISEKMEEMEESDESEREGSGDASFWSRRVKDRAHGQRSSMEFQYPHGKQISVETAKFGKQSSKGALKLTGGTRGSTIKEFSGSFPSVHHEMDIEPGSYGALPLSHHMRDRLLGDDDEGMYEVAVQRNKNFSRAGLKDKVKMVKKREALRGEEEYFDSLTGSRMPHMRKDFYGPGRKKTVNHLFDSNMSSKTSNARGGAVLDLGNKSNYVESLQKYPFEDNMIYGKGQIPNPSLRGSQVELADESETIWPGNGQQNPNYLCNQAQQKYGDWNYERKKYKKHQEPSDFHSGYNNRAQQPFQEKFRASIPIDQRGLAGSNKERRAILKNEDTESDSSEGINEEDEDYCNNPVLRSKLAFPCDMKSGSETRKDKFVKKNKKGGFQSSDFDEAILSTPKEGMDLVVSRRTVKKGKMAVDYGHVNILSAKELDENYLRGHARHYIGDNDEDDDQPIYKLAAKNGRIKGASLKGDFGGPQSNGMLEMYGVDLQERSELQLIGCSSTVKKRKIKEGVSFIDEQAVDNNDYNNAQQAEDMSSSKKQRGKRKLESDSEKGIIFEPLPLPLDIITREEDNAVYHHPEVIPLQKKPFILITPTVHTGFSFSIIHLLSAIRMAMITSLLLEDSLDVVGKNGDQQAELDANKSSLSPTHETRAAPSLAIQEIVNRVRSNPGDPSILETQEPLQDLVRGVLKILSSKTAPLGAKGWKPLVVYEKPSKSWSWVGPMIHHEASMEEEVTSPEAWGINHKMLVKLVDSFANWLKNGQETLQQIGSLPAPPSSLAQYNLDEKERFRDLRAQKSLSTITPSLEDVRAYFRKEEVLRYSIPDRAFSYTALDGKKSIVAPLRRCGGKPTSKARDHFMLKRDRPPHVTILCLVRDAAARLPGSIGTRADVCTLIRDSQYIVEEVSDTQVNQVVSGALDRLHYERDPCVQFDTERKLWVYLHRDREEEDFEDDGTSSTKKWKRQKKEDVIDQGDAPAAAITIAPYNDDDDARDALHGEEDGSNNVIHQEAVAPPDFPGSSSLMCQENSTIDNFDDNDDET